MNMRLTYSFIRGNRVDGFRYRVVERLDARLYRRDDIRRELYYPGVQVGLNELDTVSVIRVFR